MLTFTEAFWNKTGVIFTTKNDKKYSFANAADGLTAAKVASFANILKDLTGETTVKVTRNTRHDFDITSAS